MTLNEVVWRQACSIKSQSDELIDAINKNSGNADAVYSIASQTAIVLCYASYATGDISPVSIYDDIVSQVGILQTSAWDVQKACENAAIQALAHKLYVSCASLKGRLRKKLRVLRDDTEATTNDRQITVNSALAAASASGCAAACI